MKTGIWKLGKLILGAFAVFAAFGLSACIYGGGGSGDSDPLTLFVTDTTDVDTLVFDDINDNLYAGSGDFDLDKIRNEIDDKGISLATVQITDLAVSYDMGTVQFLADNAGKHFVLSIYYHEDGDTNKLALQTNPTTGTLAFNPDSALFQLNKNIFGSNDGFPDLIAAIKNTSVHSVTVTTELRLLDTPPLKKTGKLVIHFIVTVAGKA
jgi:hypothetical protein